jgi:deoxyribonuclease-4
MRLGAHIGIADGLAEAPATGHRIGCEVIQIFTKSPQTWGASPIPEDLARGFREAVRVEGLGPCAVHHSYLPNLASPKKALLTRSRKAFVDDLRRAEQLGIPNFIFHPGAHLGAGPEAGLKRIVESLDWAIGETPGLTTRALLENAAGQGSTLCSQFEEIAWVLDHVSDRSRVGVAIDTCHLFASGVDFRTDETYAALTGKMEATFGVRSVQAFHLNDSKGPLGGRVDRHENIGKGEIGREGFVRLLGDSRFTDTPGYLETPLSGGKDRYDAYETDLQTLRSWIGSAAGKPRRLRSPTRRAA